MATNNHYFLLLSFALSAFTSIDVTSVHADQKHVIVGIPADTPVIVGVPADDLITNVYNRQTTSLNGQWKYIIDPYENGYYNYRYEPFDQQETPQAGAFFLNSKTDNPSDLLESDFDRMDSIHVPGDWNSKKEKLLYYEGTVWYKKSFDFIRSMDNPRLFVYFGASNYKTEVYLNGHKLGTHIGGFTPFNFEVTEIIKPRDNFLVVKVDNKRQKDGVPTLNTDWWNYGGLTRDVKLVETPQTFIRDFNIQLSSSNNQIIEGYVQLDGDNLRHCQVELAIPGLNIRHTALTNEDGYAKIRLPVDSLSNWAPGNPVLYDVFMRSGIDTVTDQVGFRTINTNGTSILLNDKPVFLKGISIHEESPLRGGRAQTPEDAIQLLQWASELGCNYVRLAHYPHNEHMVRLADEMGLMVWAEIPVYWTINWRNEETYRNAENQLSELIARDKNRASVIIWSMANETPNDNFRQTFLTRLAAKAREMDSTRLISAALEQRNYMGDPSVRTIDDPFADVVDVLSFNEYIGWYDGLPDKCGDISWVIEHDKPVLISEFGAGAKQGLHGQRTDRWTEEFQEDLYVQTLGMIERMENVQGMSPWILVDFRSPRRVLPGIQDGWNRKGLISDDGKKKKAFHVLHDYYESK